MTKMKKFLITYKMFGKEFGDSIEALDFKDAERRLMAIRATAKVDGEHIKDIYDESISDMMGYWDEWDDGG